MARMSKEARRAQIVAGMMRAMATHGYERATIQRIAAEIDITPGLIHYHFETKQAILLATLDEISDRMSARYERALDRTSAGDVVSEAEATLGPKLIAWIDAHVSLDLGDGADAEAIAAWVAISCEATLSEEVREPFNQAIERDMAALVEALLESRASPKQPRQIALSLMAMLQGIYLLSRTLDVPGEEGFAREQLERAALGMLEVST